MSESENYPSNPVLDAARKVLRSVVLEFVFKKSIATFLATTGPLGAFFSLPVINTLFVYVAKKYYTIAYMEGEAYMTFAIIDEQVERDVVGYKDMKDELYKALQKPVEEDDSEETKRISEEYDKKLRDLIRFARS